MAQQTKSRTSKSAGGRRSSGAATKKRAAGSSSNGRASTTKPRTRTGSRSNAKRSSPTAKRASSSSRRASSSSKRSSSNGKSTVTAAKDATVEGAKDAGNAVAATAKKLRTPALAAGAGLAGLAGGIALTRDRQKKVLGVRMPSMSGARATSKNVAEAAKHVGSFAEKAGELAHEVRTTREAIDRNGSRRSPVEVVLQGLTSRK